MEESSGEEPQEKKGYKQPYNDFKTFSESIEGYCWDNEMLTILPEIDSNPSHIELPKADCELALTYQPGSSMAKNNPASQNPPLPSLDPKTPPLPSRRTKTPSAPLENPPPPLDFENVFLHALFPPSKPKEKSPFIKTTGFSLEEEFELKLQRIAPLIDASGKTFNTSAAVLKHARSEVAKHLGHIPFLNGDKHLYWEFAVAAYEKFKLGNLMTFILEEGKKKNWVGDSKENPGWSILSFKGLVQLAHMYPPIRDSGAKLSFKVVQLPSGYYLREILLSLTKNMEPARRCTALLVYQNATGKRKRGEEYKELMCFSANLNFKLDGVGAVISRADAATEAKVDKEVDVGSEKKKDEAAEEVSPEVEKSSSKKEKKKHKKKEDKEDVDAAKKVKVDEEVDVRSERKVDEEVDVTSEKKDKKKGEATVEEASAQVEKSSFKKEKKERDDAAEEASPEVENASSNKEKKKNKKKKKKKKKDKEEVDAAKEVKVDEEVDVGFM